MKLSTMLIIGILWLLGSSPLYAQPTLAASLAVSNSRPLIGEPIEVTVTIIYDVQIQVLQRPQFPKEWGIFEVINIGERFTTSENGRTVERQMITLVAWQTGDHALPKMEILYRVEGTSDLQTYTLPDTFLSIPSVLTEDSLTIQPNEPPISISFLPIWVFFIGISIVTILSVGIIELLRYYARQNVIQTHLPDPQALFLSQLDAIHDNPTYETLSHLLRTYLQGRYGILAHDMTDTEILDHLKADGRVMSYQLASLSELLEHLTVGKFSTMPIAHPPQKILKMAQAWVQNIHTGGEL
ncbi:MAG: hypothetical protein MUE54_03525 [Anaerolineae bacterium]|jgi:hypothetical protein|nr:hypothetical protein [Anaerolineae bacterium]